MKLKWKKRFKPEIILEKIEKIMTINEDGSVSYSGFQYIELKATLYSMIVFPNYLTTLQNNGLVDQAITKAAKTKSLTPDNLIEELENLFKKELKKKVKKYHLLTTISISEPLPFKKIKIGQSTIRFMTGDFPKKYRSRKDLIEKGKRRHSKLESSPQNYINVIISTQAKSEYKATSQCLNDLDLFRAMLSMFANSGMELMSDNWSPINKIRIGSIHTLHKESGEPIDMDTFWFDPNFVKASPFKLNSNNFKSFQKSVKWIFEGLKECKYSQKLENALLRYVRALDERDQNVALLHIWGALESITAYEENSKSNLPKRCAYIFAEYEYHKQVLEHLREYRNQSVHAGDHNEEARSYCYQLQGYFREIIFFHLHNVKEFNTLEEANSFLDQPVDMKMLKHRRDLLDKAIKFRGGE